MEDFSRQPAQADLNYDNAFDESENTPSNKSRNRSFADVMKAATSRRNLMSGALATAATGFLAPSMAAATDRNLFDVRRNRGLIRFNDVTIEQATVDQSLPTISTDYEYQTFIPWGTPIEPGIVKEYDGDPNTRPTSEEAALQVGIGHDGMFFFPDRPRGVDVGIGFSNRSGMLCVNHEFGSDSHVLGKNSPESLEDVRLAQNVLGVSVLAIEDASYGWEVVSSPNTRRITPNTPVLFSGPAAGSPLLENINGNIPLGTVNNCGSGVTPWGTYLTCEENFNGYFGTEDESWQPTEEQNRYGINSSGFGYDWHKFDKRFDLADPEYANEVNRFGWVVEIDPFDASKKPVKRTALGRFKHEAIAIGESQNGRIAAYMGDDQRGDYCYKYVSNKRWKLAVARGESPLDEGKLYVARFDDNFTGEWLLLSLDNPDLANRFESMDELLINTRVAADIVGATPMDRPEWTTVAADGSVFWTLTNNDRKAQGIGEVNAANPEAVNTDGHIIRTKDNRDFMGRKFEWEIFILASSTRNTPQEFSDPDAAYVDPFGRLFIGTDGGQGQGLQDQVVVFDTSEDTPIPRRLLVGVPDDELTGWGFTPNYRTAFVNVQHPGNGDPARTNFPKAKDGFTIPRDATLVITRKNRGIIGS